MPNIGGFQPQSLSDYPGKVAGVIFCQGCNLRCGFCHNPDLVRKKDPLFTEENILGLLSERLVILNGVVISGGEPTCHKDLPDFMATIRERVPELSIKLDTNGTNPKMIKEVLDLGLVDYIAIDVKTSSSKYNELTKSSISFDNVRESVDLIKESGISHELRTTVVPGFFEEEDQKSIRSIVEGAKRYMLQFFDPRIVLDKRFSVLSPPDPSFMHRSEEFFSGVVPCVVR